VLQAVLQTHSAAAEAAGVRVRT